MRRFLLVLVLCLPPALAAGPAVSWAKSQMSGGQMFPGQPQECTEDMPCWDCHTMGNRICGPLP